MKDSFKSVSATQDNPKWEELIKRANPLYSRNNDLRSEFARDYTRILHCNAYRRLKHKTQVFFSPSSDHVCTRSEHVSYVDSISNTIANYLGLNTELTKAIAISHDIGHSPFGHKGEKVLNEISLRDIGQSFWHEKNGVHFVDDIELLEDANGDLKNLDLTYAVRDGIISHCGEIDENSLKPRSQAIDLKDYTKPNEYSPYTWEACVVKISDKISYIGRDIEDAFHLNLLNNEKLEELKNILGIQNKEALNNPNIINELIIDICNNSTIEKGICFSTEKLNLINKIKEFNEQIDKMSYELRMKDSRQKFLIETEKEKEGYAKAVKLLLTDCDKNADLNKGVHGIIANLISVDKKYETAIEMTLGGMLQNIVTDSEEVAKKLVNHLRANNMGRASFLPITSIKGSKIDKIKGKFPGVIGVAADLVKFDKKYTQIVYNLLGRTVIVDNMDTGIALAKENKYGFRIVTIQGDIINASGAITGGSVAQKTVNILGRGREIENLAKEIEVLQNKISETKRSKQDYEESISEFVEDSKELDEKIQQINIVYATEKQKMLSVEEQILRLENTLSKLRNENEKIENQKADIKNQKQNIQNSVEDLEKEINELSIVIKEFAEANSENQKYIDDLNFDITNLKISVSSFDESGSSIDEIIERIDKDIENYNNAITVKNDQIEDLKREDIELKEKIESLKNQIIEIKNSVSTSTEKIEQLKLDRVNKNEELNKIEKDITDQFNLLEDLKGNLVKIDVKKTKLEQDIDLVVNNLWEEYELTPNNATDHKKVENVQTTQKEVNDIRAEIKDLGSINVDSIEEYKKTKERYDFMCEQRLDLENTISKLRKMISEITDTMKKQFVEKFKLINKNFNEVFVELFGGGKAELILEDEDNVLECGIDIKAQPTGKKLQNMMLLSGGEKAFTAIALLFAILKINPAPFCILDEIEAALDDVNVYRYAEYLKKFCSDTQFLVITHRKGTMEAADTVYGVTMEENGISKLLSMKLAQSKVAD